MNADSAMGTSLWSDQDRQLMRRALDLAARGRFTAPPNPCVGCVIVRDGQIIGEGFHVRVGEGHAEVNAAAAAGGNIRGADVYVTLEPCSHYGRTPPCAELLIRGGVRSVTAAMGDPNPRVSGAGFRMLEQAGISTRCGLLREEAETLNRGFLKRMRTGLPYVRLKMGCSMDGRTALPDGTSKWITCAEARRDVQAMRAASSAILTTSATVLADNPSMNVRPAELPEEIRRIYPGEQVRQPLLALLDQHRRIPDEAAVLAPGREVLRFTAEPREGEIFYDAKREDALPAVFRELGARQINDVWIEAGARFAGSVISADLADEIILYLAPVFLGADARPLAGFAAPATLGAAPSYRIRETAAVGSDLRVIMERKSV